MTRDVQIVQDALQNALHAVRDYVADPAERAMIYTKIQEAKLIHLGTLTHTGSTARL